MTQALSAAIGAARRTGGDAGGLQRILDGETRHVAMGAKRFAQVAESRGESQENYGKLLVRRHFRSTLKPPFNDSARQAAGLPRSINLALA